MKKGKTKGLRNKRIFKKHQRATLVLTEREPEKVASQFFQEEKIGGKFI